MAITPLDSRLWGGLYGDADLAACFTDEAEVAALIQAERALARAQGQVGVIPTEAAAAIDAELAHIEVAVADLAAGTASAGVPVPALLVALRARLTPAAAHWVHWGATSQDIVDTGLCLRLARALDLLEVRLDALIGELSVQARRHAGLPMAGRTRSQIATPITFGLRIATWAAPLCEQHDRLPDLRHRALRVQLGGAAGANSVNAPHTMAVIEVMAEDLGLAPAAPWGTNRMGLADLGAWLAQLTASLGKMAGDLMLQGRSEIAEVRAGQGGGSSTMPQKQNPVAAEAMVALARLSGPLSAALNGAMLHQEERDATAWALEWLVLPQMVVAAGASLRHAQTLAQTLVPDPFRMQRALEADGGAAMAEAAAFTLAAHMPRAEAQALVKRAVAEMSGTGRTLTDVLPTLTDAPVDWAAALDPARDVEAAKAMIEALLAGSVRR